MRYWVSWLKQWLPAVDTLPLERLTRAGFEVEHCGPVDPGSAKVLELNVTPNRGDVLSVRGLAREWAALSGQRFEDRPVAPWVPVLQQAKQVQLHDPACWTYAGVVIHLAQPHRPLPQIVRTALEVMGIGSVCPVVDLAHYVMLEWGQPFHVFDSEDVGDTVWVRRGHTEPFQTLDGQHLQPASSDLLVADAKGPLALAGIMGGARGAVGPGTQRVFIESACFVPDVLAASARRHRYRTDALYRFERGVAPDMQREALARLVALIQEHLGGEPGPLTWVDQRSACRVVPCRPDRVRATLGLSLSDPSMREVLERTGARVDARETSWSLEVPAWRWDIQREADWIEEVIRHVGYDALPEVPETLWSVHQRADQAAWDAQGRALATLVARGYCEAITYSFCDPELAKPMVPSEAVLPLVHPMSSAQSVMRPTLLATLLPVVSHHQHRGMLHGKWVEWGACFGQDSQGEGQEHSVVAGIIGGRPHHNWADPKQPIDFFDLKGDLQVLAEVLGLTPSWEAGEDPRFASGQCAVCRLQDTVLGWAGCVHPRWLDPLGIKGNWYFFEWFWDVCWQGEHRSFVYQEPSKHPVHTRDFALLLEDAVSAHVLLETASSLLPEGMATWDILDVYQGQGVPPGQKSVLLRMVLQHPERSWVGSELTAHHTRLLEGLRDKLGAVLRG